MKTSHQLLLAGAALGIGVALGFSDGARPLYSSANVGESATDTGMSASSSHAHDEGAVALERV